MRTCEACGFDNAEPGKPCPLCGASEMGSPPGPAAALSGSATGTFGGTALDDPDLAPVLSARLRTDEVLDGRFRIESFLGGGGMGQVYRVHDLLHARDAALKVIRPHEENRGPLERRFRREIEVLSLIRHPAVPPVLAWGSSTAGPYFVTELVDGADLKAEIRRRGPWPLEEAVALVATVAEALAAAHALGIVHRDVKPHNVMIGRDGRVHLLDFGLAGGEGIDLTSLTRTGAILGTPGYMSPEQLDGKEVDARSDVYSAGIVLFEALTGRLPFLASTPIALALKHKTEPPPPLRALRHDAPSWLERTVRRCLEKDPEDRFDSATSLAAELRRPRRRGPETRRLASGDSVVEDPGGATDWALVLASANEKTGWVVGMALRFEDRHYRLLRIDPPAVPGAPWTCRFGEWPAGEIFRRLVDYEQDCAERASAKPPGLGARVSRWLGGRGL